MPATIVGDPLFTLPDSLSPPVSPTKPLVYHKRPHSDIFKPDPRPYSIKTSTGILSPSNSTTENNSSYQFYVPQSPESPVKNSRSSRSDKDSRGQRHKYTESLSSNPTPLPVSSKFSSPPVCRERSGPTSSLSSAESGTADVFGGLANNIYTIVPGRGEHRAGTMPPSTAAALEASISSSGLVPDNGDKRRGTIYHTMGRRRSGGKVRGTMVASLERSPSRSGGENEDGDKDVLVHQDYGHRRTRSEHSVGSYSSASLGQSRSHGSGSNLKSNLQEDFILKRYRDQPRELDTSIVSSEEPTIEPLLASFPFPTRDPTLRLNSKIMKLHDAVVETGTVYPPPIAATATVSASNSASVAAESTGPAVSTTGIVGTAKVLPAARLDDASSRGSMPIFSHPRSIHATDSEDEESLTVGQPPALAVEAVNTWEKVSTGCTVKRVEEAVVETGGGAVAVGSVMSRRTGCHRRLEDAGLPVGDRDEFKGTEETRVEEVRLPSSAVDRQLRFEQDMSETKDMVRALSARVASVEARIGEMERAAGDLKVRGRKLMGENEVEEGTACSEDSVLPVVLAERPSWPTRSVISLVRAIVHGALDGVCTRLAGLVALPSSFSSSQPSSSAAAFASDAPTEIDSATQAREVPKIRGSNTNVSMRYKRFWTYYLLFLGLGACALVFSRRGLLLKGRLGSVSRPCSHWRSTLSL